MEFTGVKGSSSRTALGGAGGSSSAAAAGYRGAADQTRGAAVGGVLAAGAGGEYACGDVYAPDFDNSFHWKDATVNIQWPLESTPLVSKKDEEAPSFDALMQRCKKEAWC